ncbi:hypothetical protein [Olleya namhaensis]|uniref:hypothetical protein n=1 Tax=Olleya namhaensis TaxID=1144750 RepID=UPI00249288FF|nr:hypothetical protein [Olleya namhaensis]
MSKKLFLTIVFTICCSCFFYAQQFQDSLITAFKAYTNSPRETTYAHLNKSVFIAGETIGFTAYAFDKKTKKPSLTTSNLYCVIEDQNKKIIQSKLIRITEGRGHGLFNIDSLFTAGEYTFKAYTNWQKNFDEPNFYSEIIEVIDNKTISKNKDTNLESKIDAQFLPESGHAINDVSNVFGIVIKNNLGFGIPNIEGHIVDDKKNTISNFKVNQLGIGSVSFTPKENETYTAIFNHNDKILSYKINNIESKGIVLSIKKTANKVILNIKTNRATHKTIKKNKYTLTIHNGEVLKIINFDFTKQTELTNLINISDLKPGVNIFTVFDQNNKPILERLFFKYAGLKNSNSNLATIVKQEDTIIATISYKDVFISNESNFSVSILPAQTKAYNHHHNIISSTYLQPYIKGKVENAKYYFTDINNQKKYDLNNLLITQGWSSYNWFNIFNNPPKTNFVFEKGIYFKATANKTESSNFILLPLHYNKSATYVVDKKNNTFEQQNLFPINNEGIKIIELNEKGKTTSPKLYLQFYPSKIPIIENTITLLNSKYKHPKLVNLKSVFIESNLNKTQMLEEVIIKASKKQVRIDQLGKRSWGKIDLWDNKKRYVTPNLAAYFSKWYKVGKGQYGDITLTSFKPGVPPPTVFLDGMPLRNGLSQLTSLSMNIIDYVEINKSGLGEGIRGAGGTIRIYTDPSARLNESNDKTQRYTNYTPPLTFSDEKQFYKPIYATYKSAFYNQYGIIDWLPINSLNYNNELVLKFKSFSVKNINLYIEGVTDDGTFISEVKTINIE